MSHHVWNIMICTACRFKYGIPPEVELLPYKKKPADSFTHRLIEISIIFGGLASHAFQIGWGDSVGASGWHHPSLGIDPSIIAQVLEVDEEPDLQSRQVRRLKAEVPNLPDNFERKRGPGFRECHEWTWIQFCKQYWFGLNTSFWIDLGWFLNGIIECNHTRRL